MRGLVACRCSAVGQLGLQNSPMLNVWNKVRLAAALHCFLSWHHAIAIAASWGLVRRLHAWPSKGSACPHNCFQSVVKPRLALSRWTPAPTQQSFVRWPPAASRRSASAA